MEYDSFNKLSQVISVAFQIEDNSGNILVDLNGQDIIMKKGASKIDSLNSSKTYINKIINRKNYDNRIII